MNGESGRTPCRCPVSDHRAKFIVVTGGPGGGKTAALEMARRSFCTHVAILPEAASILFGGGFWRHDSIPGRQAAQRAIYHVQSEQERLVKDENKSAVVLCDRGTLDSIAYWPGVIEAYYSDLQTTLKDELARYSAVIHLRTPGSLQGYNHQNPVRTESAFQAAEIDRKILTIWAKHPNRHIVENATDFIDKAKQVIEAIRRELPACCHETEA